MIDPITLTEEEYKELCDSYGGVCLSCGEFAWSGVEPDAEGYECEDCGEHAVMGIENALIAGKVTFDDE